MVEFGLMKASAFCPQVYRAPESETSQLTADDRHMQTSHTETQMDDGWRYRRGMHGAKVQVGDSGIKHIQDSMHTKPSRQRHNAMRCDMQCQTMR